MQCATASPSGDAGCAILTVTAVLSGAACSALCSAQCFVLIVQTQCTTHLRGSVSGVPASLYPFGVSLVRVGRAGGLELRTAERRPRGARPGCRVSLWPNSSVK